MSISDKITGLQHIGVPTKSVEASKAFYAKLGFAVDWETSPEPGTKPVAFMKKGSAVVELYQSDRTSGAEGAIAHIALDVTDVNEMFEDIKKAGFELANDHVITNKLYDRGTAYFMVYGPSRELVEFNQRL